MPNPKGEKQLVAGEPAWVRLSAPSAEVKAKVATNKAEEAKVAKSEKQ